MLLQIDKGTDKIDRAGSYDMNQSTVDFEIAEYELSYSLNLFTSFESFRFIKNSFSKERPSL